MPRQSQDPLRARLFDMVSDIEQHLGQLRDFGGTPGNSWLARAELQAITSLISDLETLLGEIRQDDREQGF